MEDSMDDNGYDGPSKSQLKRDSHALQEMGKQLVEMPEGKLQKFTLPESLKEAIYEARRLKSREAKRRHLQYIGKLMRISDIDDIQITLEKMDHQSLSRDAALQAPRAPPPKNDSNSSRRCRLRHV
jgi:ribosome-associated protein